MAQKYLLGGEEKALGYVWVERVATKPHSAEEMALTVSLRPPQGGESEKLTVNRQEMKYMYARVVLEKPNFVRYSDMPHLMRKDGSAVTRGTQHLTHDAILQLAGNLFLSPAWKLRSAVPLAEQGVTDAEQFRKSAQRELESAIEAERAAGLALDKVRAELAAAEKE